MTQEQNLQQVQKAKHVSPFVYKLFYGAFVAISVYFLLFTDDFMSGVSNLGIALIFDPFDQKIRWNNRPLYQKAWLFVHVFIVMALFIYGVWIK